jgi:hypothetical protein
MQHARDTMFECCSVVRRASGLRSPLPAVPAYGAPRRACRPPLPTRPSPGSRALAAAAGDGGGDGRQGPPSRERLFDHLVGAGEERGRDGEAERLRRLEVK